MSNMSNEKRGRKSIKGGIAIETNGHIESKLMERMRNSEGNR